MNDDGHTGGRHRENNGGAAGRHSHGRHNSVGSDDRRVHQLYRRHRICGVASPHIARALAGSRYRILLPLSMLTGSLLVVLADTVGRLILSPIMIPVGIVIAFIGVPVFVHQVIRSRRNSL